MPAGPGIERASPFTEVPRQLKLAFEIATKLRQATGLSWLER